MFARTVRMHLKPNSVTQFTQTMEKDVIPVLRKQPGFRDEVTFLPADGSGDAVAISFWEKRENADAYQRGAYPEVLKALADAGYQGSIDSEYEGQRLTQDAFVTDSCEQVRRQHLAMRRVLS